MDKVIVILGPTGIGKTKTSIEVAKSINSEIISGDSVQVYKGYDIGSAKVKKTEMAGVVHHLIDGLEPSANFSVADFQKEARKIMSDLVKKDKVPIICGGTGYYIKASLYDYDFSSDSRNDEKYANYSNEDLVELIKKYAINNDIHVNNRKRLIRKLELLETNKRVENNSDKPLYDILLIVLTASRDVVYEMINKRVDLMIEAGLVKEVEKLRLEHPGFCLQQAIGYKEISSFLDGEITLEEAIELVKRNTRRFAKRQYTWINHQFENPVFVEVDLKDYAKTIERVLEHVTEFIK